MTNPTLIILQPTHKPINEAVAKALLPDEAVRCETICVSLDEPEFPFGDTSEVDWFEAQSGLISRFHTSIEPAQRKGARIVYLGATAIPLAMQLGYLLGNWSPIDAYQCHHGSHEWAWADRTQPAPTVTTKGLDDIPRTRAPCEVILRVTTGPEVNISATEQVLPEALSQLDICVDPPGKDTLERPEDLEKVADAFEAALDAVSDRLPQARIHLFAAVPVAMALKLGCRVSRTRHRPVLVYQLAARADPRFQLAFELQGAGVRDRRELSEDERERAANERAIWAEELRKLAATAQATSRTAGAWRRGHPALATPPWSDLPDMGALRKILTEVDAAPTDIAEFDFDRSTAKWRLGDELVLAIADRLPEEADRRIAARLFFLHEGVHVAWQGVTRATSTSVGRFPRVLEELDYQADSWALLQELAAAIDLGAPTATVDERVTTLRHWIWIATETFWAFDAGSVPLTEIQVRRMNRYLIWYWHMLRLERCATLEDAIGQLARKPVVEIAGLEAARASRPVYRLDLQRVRNLEIATVEGTTLQRRPTGQPYPLDELIEGFRARSGEVIRRALAGVVDNLSASPPQRG